MPKLYVEEVKEEIAGYIIASALREATAKEIDEAKRSYENSGAPALRHQRQR